MKGLCNEVPYSHSLNLEKNPESPSPLESELLPFKPVKLCNPFFQFPKSLQKHAYSYMLRILPPNNQNFRMKKSGSFHISAQNIDCGYSLEPPQQGSSNEYPQSMFLRRNKKNNVYPCKPQFYYIRVGFKGLKII